MKHEMPRVWMSNKKDKRKRNRMLWKWMKQHNPTLLEEFKSKYKGYWLL